jgi:hypothetical protein
MTASTANLKMPPQQISLPLQQQQALKPIITMQGAAQQPIRIALETPTDWPTVIATFAVGIGSILTSLIVGYLSHQNQKSQVRSSIAGLRSAWIKELRHLSSEFIGLAARIGYALQKNRSYLETSEGAQDLSRLFQVHSEIHLMLDPDKPESQSTESKMDSIVDFLRKRDFENAGSHLEEFHNDISRKLEKAWRDVKEDLRNPGKSLQ